MKILALIPARGGSKRLPGKNIRELGGKPLITWSIQLAREIPEVCDTLVSTDCSDIAAISRNEGALVPWLRPENLSTDTATSVEAALHGLDWYESAYGPVDGVMLLQPTSPFRNLRRIQEAISLFESDGSSPVVSVSTAPAQPVHPAWCFFIKQGSLVPVLDWEKMRYPYQDFDPVFVLNGSVYLIAPDVLRRDRTFVPPNSRPILMTDAEESLDIDTDFEWGLAQEIVSRSPAV